MAQDIVAKIQAAAQASGVDPDVALRIAGVESSFRPAAKNTESTAAGLFQVTGPTWKQYGGKPGKQRDVDENIRVGMKILSSNKASMQEFLGREPLPSDIYAAHFFGPTGARAVMSADPLTPVASVVSKQVMEANPQLAGKTANEVLTGFKQKFDKGGKRYPTSEPVKTTTVGQGTRTMDQEAGAAAPALSARDLVAGMGSNYQAALAAMMLGEASDEDDKDDDDKDDDTDTPKEEAYKAPTAANALSELDLGSTVSPFDAMEPAVQPEGAKYPMRFAKGGEASSPITVNNVTSFLSDMAVPAVLGAINPALGKAYSLYSAYNTVSDFANEAQPPAPVVSLNEAVTEAGKTTPFGARSFMPTGPAPVVSAQDHGIIGVPASGSEHWGGTPAPAPAPVSSSTDYGSVNDFGGSDSSVGSSTDSGFDAGYGGFGMGFAGGGFVPKAAYSPTEKRELEDFNNQWQGYQDQYDTWRKEQYDPYQAAYEKYQTEVYNPYQTAYKAYESDYAKYAKAMDAYNAALPTRPIAVSELLMGYRPPVRPDEPVAPTLAREFTMEAPTTNLRPPGLTQEAYAGMDQAALDKYAQEQSAAASARATQASADQRNRQSALNVAFNPEQFNLSLPDRIASRFMAEGGEARARAAQLNQTPEGYNNGGSAITQDDLDRALADIKARFEAAGLQVSVDGVDDKRKELDPRAAEEAAYKSRNLTKKTDPDSWPSPGNPKRLIPNAPRDYPTRAGQELLEFLQQADRMPTVVESRRVGRGYEGPKFSFSRGDVNDPGVVRFPAFAKDPYRSLVHELTHSADRAMGVGYQQLVEKAKSQGLTAAEQQVLDGYQKLYGTATRLPLTISDPDLSPALIRYRTSADELRAFGTGNMAQSQPEPGRYNFEDIGATLNPHVDPTMAQEAAIMRDLYLRRGEVRGRAEGSPPEGEYADAEAAFMAGAGDVPAPNAENAAAALAAIRGLGEYPYNLVGGGVDLATMAMRPFGYDVEKPVMGSDWIKEKATQLGIRPPEETDPTLRDIRMGTEIATSVLDPFAGARAVAQGVQKTGQAARMLEDMTIGNMQRAKIRGAAEQVPDDAAYAPLRERMEAQGNLAYSIPAEQSTAQAAAPAAQYISRLDESVATLPEKMTAGQARAMLEKVARKYDEPRLRSAFQSMDPNSKLTRADVQAALGEPLTKGWTTTIATPETVPLGKLFPTHDRELFPFGKLGIIKLERPNPEILPSDLPNVQELAGRREEFFTYGTKLQRFDPNYSYDTVVSELEGAIPKLAFDNFSESQLLAQLDMIKKGAPLYAEAKKHVQPIADVAELFHSPYASDRLDNKLKRMFEETPEVQAVYERNSREFNPRLYEDVKTAELVVRERVLRDYFNDVQANAKAVGLDLEKLPYEYWRSTLGTPPTERNIETYGFFESAWKDINARTRESQRKVLSKVMSPERYQGLKEALSEIDMVTESIDDRLGNLITEARGFRAGEQHGGLNFPNEPIQGRDVVGYSRFVNTEGLPRKVVKEGDIWTEKPFDAANPNAPAEGIHVFELQSDMRKALKEGAISEAKEAFPNMVTNSKALQQLLAKNAIKGAIDMDKRYISFPQAGSSNRPELYANLKQNLQAVAKDLGPGFEVGVIRYTDEAAMGEEFTSPQIALMWTPEAAARVKTKGVPFAKGGFVERNVYNHQKYL
jgi:hypothetical protein